MIRYRPIPENIHQKINSLADIFINDPNIIFAYLFGGLLKDKPNPLSDVDIAVYVKNIKKLDYLELFGNIADILGTDEIDLVILNTAQLSLAGRVLQNRKILIDKDPFLRHRYESIILREFFDFTLKERDILKRRYGIDRTLNSCLNTSQKS
jgi:predicted nucleotidyltransferase